MQDIDVYIFIFILVFNITFFFSTKYFAAAKFMREISYAVVQAGFVSFPILSVRVAQQHVKQEQQKYLPTEQVFPHRKIIHTITKRHKPELKISETSLIVVTDTETYKMDLLDVQEIRLFKMSRMEYFFSMTKTVHIKVKSGKVFIIRISRVFTYHFFLQFFVGYYHVYVAESNFEARDKYDK